MIIKDGLFTPGVRTNNLISGSLIVAGGVEIGKNVNVGGSVNISAELNVNGSVSFLPIGSIIMWNGSVAPTGWALCDGANGTPDLKNKFILGYESGTNTVGQVGGESTVTLTTGEIPAHTHGINDPGHKHQTGLEDNNQIVAGEDDTRLLKHTDNPTIQIDTTTVQTNITLQQTGGGGAHNNMPPYYVLAYIMRTI